jgi:pimeloyl-ACP methyl ester carboxylesterase
MPDPSISPLPDGAAEPNAAAEPEGYLVTAADGTRLHFLDWGRPAETALPPAVVLVPGMLQPAWSWAPVARRLALVRRAVVADIRGHGLSDAPVEGYDLPTLAADLVEVAEGSGALDGGPVVLAGHGFGGIVASAAAALLGGRCAGLVLVDGGWERIETTTGTDVDEFLRGLDEPPEVLRSMDAWLADRRGFDPTTWDADQERSARDGVVETSAGHVLRAVRPHVVEAVVRTMFSYEPTDVLPGVRAPITALVALASGDTDRRLAELERVGEAVVAAGGGPVRIGEFPAAAHNLMRYRPAEVTAAILAVGTTGG